MKNPTGWMLWISGLAINGVLALLWIVFGAAAAGNANASANAFVWWSILGVGAVVVTSMYFVSRERFKAAFGSTFLALPILVAILLLQ
ncbi:MAG TPA: hypothetical protein VFY24_08695 [Azospira sp.]|nr:hypothetical protein [Azospira sp.]